MAELRGGHFEGGSCDSLAGFSAASYPPYRGTGTSCQAPGCAASGLFGGWTPPKPGKWAVPTSVGVHKVPTRAPAAGNGWVPR
eukprot:scaffold14409_cov49-Phaeocystis_antarctica.AAC.4